MNLSAPHYTDSPLDIAFRPGKSGGLVVSFAGPGRDAPALPGGVNRIGRYHHRMSQKLKKRGMRQPIFSAFIAGDQTATPASILAAGGPSLADYHHSRRAAKAA